MRPSRYAQRSALGNDGRILSRASTSLRFVLKALDGPADELGDHRHTHAEPEQATSCTHPRTALPVESVRQWNKSLSRGVALEAWAERVPGARGVPEELPHGSRDQLLRLKKACAQRCVLCSAARQVQSSAIAERQRFRVDPAARGRARGGKPQGAMAPRRRGGSVAGKAAGSGSSTDE